MPDTKNPWFQKRHYEFLVNWASIHIHPVEVASLADVLAVDNPRFDRKRFLKTYVELRRFAKIHEVMHAAAANGPAAWALKPSPSLTERDEDVLGSRHGQTHLPHSSLVPVSARHHFGPVVNMDAHIRAHAGANRGRGMWEYTSCWKCDSGRRPDQCPVACKGACEYPSSVND